LRRLAALEDRVFPAERKEKRLANRRGRKKIRKVPTLVTGKRKWKSKLKRKNL
jgi:hypothetical protein